MNGDDCDEDGDMWILMHYRGEFTIRWHRIVGGVVWYLPLYSYIVRERCEETLDTLHKCKMTLAQMDSLGQVYKKGGMVP